MVAEPLDPIPLSALQHWCYCPRQCVLIHIEQVFAENLYTQRGQALHKRVDDPGFELRDGLRVERELPLFSDGPCPPRQRGEAWNWIATIKNRPLGPVQVVPTVNRKFCPKLKWLFPARPFSRGSNRHQAGCFRRAG